MFKCSQIVILLVICLATITAYPQYNNGCNEFQISETYKNSELNQNVKKCATYTPNSSSDPLKEQNIDGRTLPISNIFIQQDSDLSILNIPYKNKDKSIDILHSAIQTLNNNDYKPNKTKSEINLEFNEPVLNILNIPYKTTNKQIDILNTATKSLNNNENNTKNKTENNFKENNENKLSEQLLNKTIDLKNIIEAPNTTLSDESSSTVIPGSEITNLSLQDDEESMVGQKIKFQRSNMNSDIVDNNSAGAEILKNMTDYCGTQFGKRISFANMTTLMEFPWTVLLLYNTKIRYHCGGSLITTKYVLTAAHCVSQEFYELGGVRLGEHDISENPDCAPDIVGENICATTIDVDVVKIIVHHAYSHMSFKNDIALLRLDNEYIGRSYYPICLPSPERSLNIREAVVAGWGATEKTIRSAVLLKANVPIIDISKCREIYRYSVFNDSTEMCGSGVNEVDVCKGDSGGALFYQDYIAGKDKYYQLGIISLGVRQCGDKRFLPAVFTKIIGYSKWIENNLEY